MKIMFLLLLNLIAFSITSAQWVNENPVPNGNSLRSVFFINDNIGWIIGSDGFIMKTTNSGTDWIHQSSGTITNLMEVRFVDEQTGWIVGESGKILKTINGGLTWIPQSSGTTYNLYSIHFINSTTGWVVGWGGTILKTTNGGITWIFHNTHTHYDLFSVCFINASIGWTVGVTNADRYPSETDSSIILKTTDGGQTWVKKGENLTSEYPTVGFLTVEFIDTDNGFVGGGYYNGPGLLLRTTNGGESWFSGYSAPELFAKTNENLTGYMGIQDIYFKDSNNGYYVIGTGGYFTEISVTTDGGENWISKYSHPEQFGLYSIFVTNAGNGWAVGDDGQIFITEDNGNSWAQQLSSGDVYGGEEDIYDIYFVNDKVGWAVGSRDNFMDGKGVILKTTNSGKIWKTQYWESSTTFKSVYFIDENFGWANTNGGNVYSTTNGGENWSLTTSDFRNFSSIFFVDQNNGWATIDDEFYGGIVKSNNGGITWIEKSSISSSSIYFSDINNGWAVGDSGSILKSIDNGETWVPKTSGTTNNLNSVQFCGSNLGMCVGNKGTVLLSIDGGESWCSKSCGIIENLQSVSFTNSTSAWVVGSNGIIMETTDLGNNWTSYDEVTPRNLNTVFFANENAGWAGGMGGAMFRYQNDILPVEFLSFTAKAKNNEIQLNWQTATEVNNSGFEILRQSKNTSWATQGFVEGHGTSISLNSYSFIDNVPLGESKFRYKLKQIDTNGKYSFSKEIEVEIAPTNFAIYQNYPNPFNPITNIRYQLPEESKVVIKIYDVLGAEVMTLLNENKEPGIYDVEFNAQSLSSGTYIYQINAGDFIGTKKMLLLK